MIEKIYIPTRKRANNQITYNNLPIELQKKTILVVNHDEDLSKYDKKFKVLKLGKEINTISEVRKAIVFLAGNIKYCIFDDDLNFSYHFFEKTADGWAREMVDADYLKLFELMDEKLNTYQYGSLKETCYPPSPDKHGVYQEWDYNGRIMQTVFYNGATIPKEKIKWTGIPFAEDHYVNIQMLLLGCQCAINQRYNTSPGLARNAAGGCSEQRSLEKHNQSWKDLAATYPQYVTLREKPDKKTGAIRLSGTIRWKKLVGNQNNELYFNTKQQKLF
jgi:hypothetical protein